MRRNGGRWAAVLVVALLAASCGGSEGDEDSGGTALRNTVPPSPNERSGESGGAPAPAVDPSDQVIPDYRAYWRAFIDATRRPDPNDTGLKAHATSDALQVSKDVLIYMQESKLVGRGDVELAPRVVSVLRTSAEVADCYRSGLAMHDAKSGVLRERPDSRRQRLRVHLVRENRTWKVALIERQEYGCTEA